MIHLDLRTVIVMSSVVALLLSVVLLMLRNTHPKSIQGMGFWATAPTFTLVAALLAAGRGLIHDLLSIVAANMLMLAALLSFYWGAQRFLGFNAIYKTWLGVALATLLFLLWFGWIEPSYTARILLMTALSFSLVLQMMALIWRHGKRSFPSRFTVLVLAIYAGVMLLRSLVLQPMVSAGYTLDPARIQPFYIVEYTFGILALAIGFILMVSERLRDEFEYAATYDHLTNALLRRALLAACEQELERCRRHGRSMALLMLDIDHFKSINDTHGHHVGDRVLIDFVNRIKPLLRRMDQIGRFGGEEFVVLLPEASQDEASIVAERIRSHVSMPINGLPPITVSIGMTSNRPGEGEGDIDLMLARADKALYQAKGAGRNRVEVA